MKQKLRTGLTGLGILLMVGTANAAKSGKSGLFIGLEANYSNIYYSHLTTNAKDETSGGEKEPPHSSGVNYSGNLLVGQRYYLNNTIGYGLKSWIGASNYDHTSIYYHNAQKTDEEGDFIIKSDSVVLGLEAQVYIDFLKLKRGSLGVMAGVGYELTRFYNGSVVTQYAPNNTYYEADLGSYSDSSIVYDVAFNYNLGDRNRIEIGYKAYNYSKTVRVVPPNLSVRARIAGFNVDNSIYANYTFKF